MELNRLIGFRLKDVLEILGQHNISNYSFEVTKEPRAEKRQITEDFRVLRIKREDDTVYILVCFVD